MTWMMVIRTVGEAAAVGTAASAQPTTRATSSRFTGQIVEAGAADGLGESYGLGSGSVRELDSRRSAPPRRGARLLARRARRRKLRLGPSPRAPLERLRRAG